MCREIERGQDILFAFPFLLQFCFARTSKRCAITGTANDEIFDSFKCIINADVQRSVFSRLHDLMQTYGNGAYVLSSLTRSAHIQNTLLCAANRAATATCIHRSFVRMEVNTELFRGIQNIFHAFFCLFDRDNGTSHESASTSA